MRDGTFTRLNINFPGFLSKQVDQMKVRDSLVMDTFSNWVVQPSFCFVSNKSNFSQNKNYRRAEGNESGTSGETIQNQQAGSFRTLVQTKIVKERGRR